MEPITVGTENRIVKPYYNNGLNALKFWLMPFVCLVSFPCKLSSFTFLTSYFSQFTPIAFYIICGFIVAAKEGEEAGLYGRLVKKTAKQFLLLFGICFLMNALLYLGGAIVNHAATGQWRTPAIYLFNKKTIFDFVVLCAPPPTTLTFPIGDGVRFLQAQRFGESVISAYKSFPTHLIGETISFLQALLYARIILWLMNKYKLMRYYKVIMCVTLLAMILFGELAGLIRFNVHGYTYIPVNGVIRALPYMLLGRFLYENRARFFSLPSLLYIGTFLLGIAAAVGELFLLDGMNALVYAGHLIGYAVMALSACCYFLKRKKIEKSFAASHGGTYSRRIYMWSQPVGHALLIGISLLSPQLYEIFDVIGGITVYFICFAIAYLTGFIRFTKRKNKRLA